MAERIEENTECDCMACRAVRSGRRTNTRPATSGYLQAELPDSDYRSENAKLRAELAVKETELAAARNVAESYRIASGRHAELIGELKVACDLYEKMVPEMLETSRNLLRQRDAWKETHKVSGDLNLRLLQERGGLQDELNRTRQLLKSKTTHYDEANQVIDRLESEVKRTIEDRDGYRNELSEVIQGLRDTEKERDELKNRCSILQSELDEKTALAADLNGQLDQLRVMIGKVEDTGAYRDWCFRLERLASDLDDERQRFLAYAAERFDDSGGGAGDPGSIVGHIAHAALMNLEDMPDAGWKSDRIERVRNYREVVAEYCKNGYTPE